MSKRTLLMVAALIVSLAVAATGTLAYLSDSDMDTNVMTLGNVDILQNEQERTEDGELDEFTQNKPLYPAVFEGSSIPWADPSDWVVENDQAWKVVEDNENVVDKFVTVTNTGKSEAFIRTIIAYEGDATYGPEGAYIHVVHNGNNVDPAIDIKLIGTVNIDGTDYTVYSYTYPEALAAGETSIPSLKQLYMNKAADNDVMEEYGDTYDVLVLSQAVQTQGFDDAATALDTAFGDVTADNVVEWFGEATIGSPGEENNTNNPPDIIPETNWAVEGKPSTAWYDADPTAASFEISTAEDLAGLAKLVNEGNNFQGKTITLTDDVDLAEHEWTPIGADKKPFSGKFDGGNHTISNLKVDMTGKSNVGLFGFTTNGSIKNFVVDNAIVKGYLNVGVVAGTPYTSKYDNITVTGLVKVDGFAYVGGLGGKNAYADISNITVDVDSASYIRADSVENGTAYRTYVGGVIGFMGEGGHTVSNVTSNIDVYGSTIDVGGITGMAHYNNKFVNCVCTGDVEIFNAEEAADAEEIGGIAGVWHNKDGTTVTMSGCSFTGTLTANVDGVDLSDNTIAGNAYSASGNGQLIIN